MRDAGLGDRRAVVAAAGQAVPFAVKLAAAGLSGGLVFFDPVLPFDRRPDPEVAAVAIVVAERARPLAEAVAGFATNPLIIGTSGGAGLAPPASRARGADAILQTLDRVRSWPASGSGQGQIRVMRRAPVSRSSLAGMDTLTLDQIAAKITTAENGLATATDPYDRNLLIQIRDEYRRYAAERGKQEAKLAAGAAAASS